MSAAVRTGASRELDRALIDVDLCLPGIPLQAHPVSTLKSGGARSPRGSGVAASGSLLAYSLSNGLIRVVNLEDGGRTLLRSHAADICDLQVCDRDVLCSAAVDGTVLLQQLDLVRILNNAGQGNAGASSRTAACSLLKLCLPPVTSLQDCIRLCVHSTGLCAATMPRGVLLVDAEAAKLARNSECHSLTGTPTFEFELLPAFASVTAVDIGRSIDLAFAPSGGLLAILVDTGDVVLSAITGRTLASRSKVVDLVASGKRVPVDAVAWARDDLLVCAAEDTKTLYVCDATPGGEMEMAPIQCLEIALPSPLRLVAGGEGGFLALCGITRPIMLLLNIDGLSRCIHSTTAYSLDAPAVSLAAGVPRRGGFDVFVVDSAGISRYAIDIAAGNADAGIVNGPSLATSQCVEAAAKSAIDARMDVVASQVDDLKRLILQSRSEVETKFTAQGAALRRVLVDELRECVRSSLVPSLDRALAEAFGQIEEAIDAGVERMNFATAQSSDLIASIAGRHEQVMTEISALSERFPGKAGEAHASTTREELRGLVAAQRYEAAFTVALGNSDVALLSWLCSQVRPEDVFSTSPLMLGQEVVLSLAQQLGCDLRHDPSTKAVWIRDAVLALNCSDPVLMPHIQAVLSDLYLQLDREASECDGGVQSELRLCMRVIKTQLRE